MPSLPDRPRLRLAGVGLAGAFLLSACGNPFVTEIPADGVSMKKAALDLAFGEEPAPVVAAPPALPAAPPPPIVAIVTDVNAIADPLLDLALPPAPPPRTFEQPEPVSPCPEPGPNVVAERPIELDVKEPIAAGSYQFQQKGTIELVGLATIPIDTLTQRVVRNVKGDENGFDYEVESTIAGRREVAVYRVSPGRAISLVRLTRSINGETTTFAPALPVDVFPLPAIENATVTGAGTDPLTGTTLLVQGRVTEKQRLLGCGEVVDGWFLDATWTFVEGGQSRLVEYDTVVAPQHGGLVVGDHLKGTERNGPLVVELDVASTFGSLTPQPEEGGRR